MTRHGECEHETVLDPSVARDGAREPFAVVPLRHPSDVDVTPAPDGRALGPMLESGEIDAMISAHPPRCVLDARRG